MEGPAGEPEEPGSKARWSEAAGQAILLSAIAWSVFALAQAHWYMPRFHVRPYEARWAAVTFLTGALPPLLVLFASFIASWLIRAVRGRADSWRAYRDGLIVASLFTLLVNFGLWFSHGG
jgi:hypothetical protein